VNGVRLAVFPDWLSPRPLALLLRHGTPAERRYAARILGAEGGRIGGGLGARTKAERQRMASLGGRARAEKLSAEQLRRIALMGVEARQRKSEGRDGQ